MAEEVRNTESVGSLDELGEKEDAVPEEENESVQVSSEELTPEAEWEITDQTGMTGERGFLKNFQQRFDKK